MAAAACAAEQQLLSNPWVDRRAGPRFRLMGWPLSPLASLIAFRAFAGIRSERGTLIMQRELALIHSGQLVLNPGRPPLPGDREQAAFLDDGHALVTVSAFIQMTAALFFRWRLVQK